MQAFRSNREDLLIDVGVVDYPAPIPVSMVENSTGAKTSQGIFAERIII